MTIIITARSGTAKIDSAPPRRATCTRTSLGRTDAPCAVHHVSAQSTTHLNGDRPDGGRSAEVITTERVKRYGNYTDDVSRREQASTVEANATARRTALHRVKERDRTREWPGNIRPKFHFARHNTTLLVCHSINQSINHLT